MHRYKYIYRIVQIIFLVVSAALLLFLLLPIWLYEEKQPSEITFESVGSPMSDGSLWVTEFNKMDQNNVNADISFFQDAKVLNRPIQDRIVGKAAVFEMLHSQETISVDAQKRLEFLTGVSYTGFWGKTFEDLSDKEIVPPSLMSLYEKTAQSGWSFRGEGIIITDGKRVIVLRQGKEYKNRMEFQSGNNSMPYYGYFEITSGVGPAAGEFSLELTEQGSDIFKTYGLPETFPAIYKIENNLYSGYYFAGNFSDLEISEPFAYETMPWLLSHKGIYDQYKNDQVYWKAYFPIISGLVSELNYRKESGLPLIAVKAAEKSAFTADSEKIYLNNEKEKKPEPFFIKGINLGAALPGKGFTEFPQEKEVYSKWLAQMASLNINTVRVYTLLPPEFYQALYEYNALHKAKPLYLLQEIWPEERPEGNNYLSKTYNDMYRQEIEYTVRAIHGDIVIPERTYRSGGMYVYDVSSYLIGYLVGRELEPDEVLSTDLLNKGYQYQGNYIYSEPSASPTESWLAQSCDYALSVEDGRYQNKPLAAIVSWPTLDPMEHDSEWNSTGNKALQYNDKAVVDIKNIGTNRDRVSGFLGAYHIYPNYPDFMNNDTAYNSYRDKQGRFRYGGYLEEFMRQHKKYPAIVAEFGIATSLVTAHYSPDEYNHGGLKEREQTKGIIRMADAIVKEGYDGAVVFEWMDEWTKKTWTTENYMIPYNRHMLWHNVLDPEQNYGLLAIKANEQEMKSIYQGTGKDFLNGVSAGQDASYFNVELTFKDKRAFSKPVSLQLSTYSMAGERRTIWEFIIQLSPDPKILANPGYNWIEGHFASVDARPEYFEEMIKQTNTENLTKDGVLTQAKYVNLSRIPGLVTVEGQKAWVRLPYGLIGFSDPSSRKVLYDPEPFIPTGIDQIGVLETPDIRMKVIADNKEGVELVYKTAAWDEPDYIEREKDGFRALSEYFNSLE